MADHIKDPSVGDSDDNDTLISSNPIAAFQIGQALPGFQLGEMAIFALSKNSQKSKIAKLFDLYSHHEQEQLIRKLVQMRSLAEVSMPCLHHLMVESLFQWPPQLYQA